MWFKICIFHHVYFCYNCQTLRSVAGQRLVCGQRLCAGRNDDNYTHYDVTPHYTNTGQTSAARPHTNNNQFGGPNVTPAQVGIFIVHNSGILEFPLLCLKQRQGLCWAYGLEMLCPGAGEAQGWTPKGYEEFSNLSWCSPGELSDSLPCHSSSSSTAFPCHRCDK